MCRRKNCCPKSKDDDRRGDLSDFFQASNIASPLSPESDRHSVHIVINVEQQTEMRIIHFLRQETFAGFTIVTGSFVYPAARPQYPAAVCTQKGLRTGYTSNLILLGQFLG